MEVGLVKNLLHNLPVYKQTVPEESDALQRIADGLLKQDKEARDASAAAVVPVKHRIAVERVE